MKIPTSIVMRTANVCVVKTNLPKQSLVNVAANCNKTMLLK